MIMCKCDVHGGFMTTSEYLFEIKKKRFFAFN